MNVRLKYSLPLSILFIGLVLVMFKSYNEMQVTKENMLKESFSETRVLGNRISNQLSTDWQDTHLDKYLVRSTISSYMVNYLDQVDIYDENKNILFSQYISSHKADKKEPFNTKIYNQLIKDKFSHLEFQQDHRHIIGYFPIDLPLKNKNQMYSRSTGVLILVFDITKQYNFMQENIYYALVSNIVVLLLMVLSIYILLYLLIFKRLSTLHNATIQLSSGDMNVNVKTTMNDELTDVIKTFNDMAHQMSEYKNTMEEKIQLALDEHQQQNKILIQQSKLASMGEMIGNIAHQWRQPLNALGLINQKIALMSRKGKLTDEQIQKNTLNANELILSMSHTINDFRDFFKPNKQAELFSLNDAVIDSLKLLDASLKESNINLSLSCGTDFCKVLGYKNEFIQVLVNIINNSKDALKEKVDGSRDISLSGKRDSNAIILTISDNGGGIPENIIDRIFEPYYTTKEEGQGTGIGLYMSKIIIEENMNGLIDVQNTDDGVVFTITFYIDKEDN
ncbi:ATP-binding protein [Sulfurimonas sp.]|nr:ATP-binding protein [Sulfurimonas sp.]